jgi:glycosyltransferase involved in cell wall biosynthesis
MVFYAYFGYPLSLHLLSPMMRKKVNKATFTPVATFIITAFNEEKRIRQKLENTLSLNYPKGLLQIIVASDGSSDRTNDIVREFAGAGVQLVEVVKRGGKENAQKEAVAYAEGEVIVFSDVATMIEPESLTRMVANFADPTVGSVSSVDRVIGKDGKPCGEGFYVRYEMWLRGLESRVNSLVGLSGSFFAARKEVCRDFSGEMQSDFRTVLNSKRIGLRGVSDPDVVGYYSDVSDSSREFDRKIRTVLRGLTVFFKNPEFLNFFRYGLFSYQYLCHKLLRWLVPFALVVCFAANLLLSIDSRVFRYVLLLQIAFYAAGFWGWRNRKGANRLLVKIPLYFITVNLAIAVAWWRYLQGSRMVMWTPSDR